MPPGLSEERLENTHALMRRYVDAGALPGCLCLVSRGSDTWFRAYGSMDVDRRQPIWRDVVFRIYSMTKPVVSVALMALYEEGRFQLDDPVAKFIPSWSKQAVFHSGDADSFSTVPPERPMTVKDLLTHTSGLTYGFMESHPVDALYRRHKIGEGNLEGLIEALAELPLLFSPGTRWNYGYSTDVCGYLVQVLADMPLDAFVRERITAPLGMENSGFQVPGDALNRFAACYEHTGENAYRLQDDPHESRYLKAPKLLSGGGGMVSTVDDYHCFCRMLLGKGELDGTRILGRKTVEYMTRNHLPGGRDLAAMGQPVFSETPYDGIGFGLGFSVVLDPAAANVLDSPGEFAWGGAASTYFWVDPVEALIVIFMTQLLPSSAYPIRRELKATIYPALID